MDFNVFAHSRDLLCLAGASTGLAAGCLLSCLNTAMPRRSRSRRIALALLFFSGTVAALAGAVIVSRNAIFSDSAVVAVAVLCTVVFALAACFPRAAAYPLILAGGLALVWLGYSFLRFPQVLLTPPAVSVASVSCIAENKYHLTAADDRATALEITGGLASIEVSAGFISIKRYFPLFGGTVRGMVTQISRGADVLYADDTLQTTIAFTVQKLSAAVPFNALTPGTKLDLLYNGESLYFAVGR